IVFADQTWKLISPTVSVPESVVDVVRHRLARLSDVTSELLRIGAVIGRDIDLDVLSLVAGEPIERVLDALDEALRARLVEEAGSTCRFVHDLVRSALYEEQSAARRRSPHARVVDVLEQRRPDDIAALAYHAVAAAADPRGAARAADLSVRAGEAALHARAFGGAAAHFRTALQPPRARAPHDPLTGRS